MKRDPVIPGLATVLDPARFAAALRTHLPELQFSTPVPHYTRYKRETSCLVAYSATLDGRPLELYARAHAAEGPGRQHGKLDKVRERATAAASAKTAAVPVATTLSEQAIAVFVFPRDHELRALPLLFDPEARLKLLRRVLGGERFDSVDPDAITLVPLRYKPERRFVAMLEIPGRPRMLLKVHGPGAFSRARQNASILARMHSVQTPLLIAAERRYGLILSEWIDGRSLAECQDWVAPEITAPDIDVLERTGAALARLHRSRLPSRAQKIPPAPAADEQALTALAAIRDLCPELCLEAREVAASIAARLSSRGAHTEPVLVHGDFSPDQVILPPQATGGSSDPAQTGERPTVIDFDRAVLGPPARDLGSFAAWVLVHSAPCDATPMIRAFLHGYTRKVGNDALRDMQAYTALAVLSRATEPFRRRQCDWPDRVRALIQCAAEQLHAR